VSDPDQVAGLLPTTSLQMQFQNGTMTVFVDGRDITPELRTSDVSAAASIVSAIPVVREWLLPVQRQIAQRGSVVAEGRDIGTKVFPSAHVKFFLDADATVRAERRHRELVAAGHGAPLEKTHAELSDRDARDRTRSVAPLVPAEDAKHIDTSSLKLEEVVDQMMAVVASTL
jgi:cytidylate kinase